MLGKIIVEGCDDVEFYDPNAENLIALTSCAEPVVYDAPGADPKPFTGTLEAAPRRREDGGAG